MEKSMTFDEFYKKILEICPTAVCEDDNQGQMVIYTGMKLKSTFGKTEVVPFKESEEDNQTGDV
jgi:hypothetical protein